MQWRMKHSVRNFIGLVLVGLLGLAWLGTHGFSIGPREPDASAAAPAESSGDALIGGHFELVNGQDFTMTEKNFSGKYMLIYFGYTHCPDLCPTALGAMQNAVAELGIKPDKLVPIFITIDPDRDTPKVMGDYVAHFGPNMVGLTGTPAQIKQAADAYKVYYAKVPDEKSPSNYSMDHSGFIYLMGPDGKYMTHFPYNIPETQLKDALDKMVQ